VEIINNLSLGFATALTLQNLMWCAIGCIVGTTIGLIPGLGPVVTISLLLPLTYHMPTVSAIIMLAGIYYGAQYGDSVSAITMKIPHSSSIIACIDGHEMHLQGRTGLALFTAGFSSFIGGTIAVILIGTTASSLGEVAFMFGPPEYCLLMLMGLMSVGMVTTGNIVNGLGIACIGVLLGMVGTDINSGVTRFTMDIPDIADGIGMVSIALGFFGLAEIIKNLEQESSASTFGGKFKLIPTWEEFKRIIPSALRGSAVGSLIGLLPGGGPTMAQFGAYAIDKKFSKYKDEIGSGAIEGVAGQAAADEAAARTSFIPLMTLGIPENAVMALMLGALTMKGLQPGPGMIAQHPALFWGLIASMWIGNFFLLFLNVPLVRFWLSIFKIPYSLLFPGILFFCCIGTYSVNNNIHDVYLVAALATAGYVFLKLGLDAAPLLLGFILGPLLEEQFRRQMIIGRGDITTFVHSPISIVLASVIGIIILVGVFRLSTPMFKNRFNVQ
jgi:putative tricarboxylic transport membrane protein